MPWPAAGNDEPANPTSLPVPTNSLVERFVARVALIHGPSSANVKLALLSVRCIDRQGVIARWECSAFGKSSRPNPLKDRPSFAGKCGPCVRAVQLSSHRIRIRDVC